jgi:hypothetical protein
MGTLCKNCPFRGTKKEEGHCTDLFIKRYHNSCVTYDIVKDDFMKKVEAFSKQKKKENKAAEKPKEAVVEEPQTEKIETPPTRKRTTVRRSRKANNNKETKTKENE